MTSIAHVVNPVIVSSKSDLYHAQPVTFESMRRAKAYASGIVDVELFSVQYKEDHQIVPSYIYKTEDLTSSILDFTKSAKKRKLPLIKDILQRVLNASESEYVIYTNVDISLLPNFYTLVDALIKKSTCRNSSFVINRRVISDNWISVDDIELMYAQVGLIHPGYDCFIFSREVISKFDFGNTCIGANWIGRVILANLIAYTDNCTIHTDYHITFHIGEAGEWMSGDYNQFDDHNKHQLIAILDRLLKNEVVQKNEHKINKLIEISNYLSDWYKIVEGSKVSPVIISQDSFIKKIRNKISNLISQY
jgi:hypothetical protein